MLRVLIAIAIALPLYELLRYRVLRRLRESQRRKARSYAEKHGVGVDLFKFGGNQLVREELLNDRAILGAMQVAADGRRKDCRRVAAPVDAQREARTALREDLPRTRELARFEGEPLAAEESEEIVRLGLERLVQRRALELADGRIQGGSHPHGPDLLAYRARSLAALEQPSVRPLEARLGTPT